jgi:hypothetical protein
MLNDKIKKKQKKNPNQLGLICQTHDSGHKTIDNPIENKSKQRIKLISQSIKC